MPQGQVSGGVLGRTGGGQSGFHDVRRLSDSKRSSTSTSRPTRSANSIWRDRSVVGRPFPRSSSRVALHSLATDFSPSDDPPKCFPTASERKKIFNEEVEDGEQEEEDEEELDEDAEGGGGFDIIDDDGDDEGEQRLDERHQELAPETPPNVPVFPAATARAPTVRATRRDEREPTEEELMFAESERVEPKRRHHPNASGQQQQQQTAAKKRRVDSTDERSASNHG